MNKDVIKRLDELLSENQTCALVTITKSTGSSPARTGQQMLISPDGSQVGTCGGGNIEYQLTQDAVEAIKTKENKQVAYNLKEVEMACGGNVEAFIDVYANEKSIIIVGAGHVGNYLYDLATIAGFHLTIVEDREDYIKAEDYPNANVIFGKLEDTLPDLNVENANVVIVTRGHEVDGVALKLLVDKNYRYLGLIGSKRKVLTILEKTNVDHSKYPDLYAPIGLGIATKDPAEIAVGILAEIILLKNKGRLEHMRIEK